MKHYNDIKNQFNISLHELNAANTTIKPMTSPPNSTDSSTVTLDNIDSSPYPLELSLTNTSISTLHAMLTSSSFSSLPSSLLDDNISIVSHNLEPITYDLNNDNDLNYNNYNETEFISSLSFFFFL